MSDSILPAGGSTSGGRLASPSLARIADRATHAQVSDAERSMGLDVEQLYRRYGDMVLGRCRTLLRDECEAQDACQEVFLKVHRYRHGFRGQASPSTYLFRVTTTTCLNRIRSRHRRREELEDEPRPVPVEDSMLSGHELRDLVTRLMDEVDPGTQACIIYHYVDGMTYPEIAEMMGLSAAAIRKRIATFRARFAAHPPPWLSELDD